ncbi:MAG: hypothetical protein L0Z73_11965 [Gammaproteobacteria bacterium]|nr:hypothetical protein [Gammaproteobacteria bacterium]
MFYQHDAQNPGGIIGVLALDSTGSVVWFQGADFSAPSHTVATDVSTISVLASNIYDNWIYLIADGDLYSYKAGDTSLGESLYALSSDHLYRVSYNEQPDDVFYAIDGQKFLRVSSTIPGSPALIATDPLFELVTQKFFETTTHLYLYLKADVDNKVQTIEVNKTTRQIKELFSFNTINSVLVKPFVHKIGENYYYTDEVLKAVMVADSEGNIIETFPDTFILKTIASAVIEPGTDQTSHLLLGEYYGDSETSISVLDIASNSIMSHIGSVPFNGYYKPGSATHYDGRIIIPLVYGGSGYDLYFADLNEDGSLTHIGDSATNARLISFTWIATPGFPPPPHLLHRRLRRLHLRSRHRRRCHRGPRHRRQGAGWVACKSVTGALFLQSSTGIWDYKENKIRYILSWRTGHCVLTGTR